MPTLDVETTQMRNMTLPLPQSLMVIGWHECISLPELGLKDFAIKVDTGAKTATLHANGIILRVLKDIEMLPLAGIAKPKAGSIYTPTATGCAHPRAGSCVCSKAKAMSWPRVTQVPAISDPFGDGEIEVITKHSGIIVGRAVMPIVQEGDALFHIAAVTSANMAIAPWLNALEFYGTKDVVGFHDLKNVPAYVERFFARPAVAKAKRIPDPS